ncbi:MAG: hypothetical protein ACXADY_15895 [Candidatus Hodarchaeales archaeon]|jgi:hypothetical protein
MMIREFLCVLEYGLMLFHVGHPQQKGKHDQFLRSNLISALYSFVTQVENDTIDSLRMDKVTLLFQKQDELIFILALDSSIDSAWCMNEFHHLVEVFFQTFPEVQWQQGTILDLRTFETFKILVKQRLHTLNKRVELLKLLLDERLIAKNEYPHHGLDCLGAVVAGRLLQRYHYHILDAIRQKNSTLHIADKLLDCLEGGHVTRSGTVYIFDCDTCALCHGFTGCFFESLVETLLIPLGYETHVKIPQKSSMKYVQISSSE